jgi:hypothetical protein
MDRASLSISDGDLVDALISVLRSGSVRFFDPKGGNRQPQPVATDPHLTGTATEPVQPVPVGPVASKRPVRTGFTCCFRLLTKICIILNKTN